MKLTSSLASVAAQFAPVPGPKPRPVPKKQEPVPTKSVAVAGTYTAPGKYGVFGGFSFLVAPGGTRLLNVYVLGVALTCRPAGSFPGSNQVVIPEVAIEPNGSFSATGSQQGVFNNEGARFTYSFAGRFRGTTPAGPPTAAGTLNERVVFPANGTSETCTSNLQPWAATHDPQPAPAKLVAAPGSYSSPGRYGYYGGFSFFVSPGGTSLLNVHILGVALACTPAGSFPGSDQVIIPEVAIQPNGSFSATGSQQAIFDSQNAKFAYAFAGSFEGVTPLGTGTVTGTFREDIVFPANGTSETCTSNLQPWSATHDPQPAPARLAAAPGRYSSPGRYGYYGGFSFTVAPGGTISNLSIPGVALACSPAGSFPGSDQVVIPEVTVRPNGSFVGTAVQQGVFDNQNARFTYAFSGSFEGATPLGTGTVAGTFREDIVFPANGTTENCSSNAQPWSAIRG